MVPSNYDEGGRNWSGFSKAERGSSNLAGLKHWRASRYWSGLAHGRPRLVWLAVALGGQGRTWLALGALLGRLARAWAALVAGSGLSGVRPLCAAWVRWIAPRSRLVGAHSNAEQSQASRDAFVSSSIASGGFSRWTQTAVGWVRPEYHRRHGRSSDLVWPAVDLVRGGYFGERECVREEREGKKEKE